jgi:hypothetical protein
LMADSPLVVWYAALSVSVSSDATSSTWHPANSDRPREAVIQPIRVNVCLSVFGRILHGAQEQ